MKVGVIGSGAIGGTVGTLWARAGHGVLFSSRRPERLAGLAERAGGNARAGTVAEAASFGEAVLLAVPYGALDDALDRAGAKKLARKDLVMDATNPFGVLPDGGETVGEALLARLPGARVVRVFATVWADVLASEAHRDGDPLAIPIAGDDAGAKELAAGLVRDAGFATVDVGTLSESGPLDTDGALWDEALAEAGLRGLLALSPPSRPRPKDNGRVSR